MAKDKNGRATSKKKRTRKSPEAKTQPILTLADAPSATRFLVGWEGRWYDMPLDTLEDVLAWFETMVAMIVGFRDNAEKYRPNTASEFAALQLRNAYRVLEYLRQRDFPRLTTAKCPTIGPPDLRLMSGRRLARLPDLERAAKDLLDWMRKRLSPDSEQRTAGRSGMTKLATALGLLAAHPDWSDAKIMDEAQVCRTTMYKKTWRRYLIARAAMNANIPRGMKSSDGTLEAVAPAD